MDPNLDPAIQQNIKVILPMIRKIIPNLIAQEIIGVQPMSTLNYTNWEKWFAWHPVILRDGTKVWMQSIYRRQPTGIFKSLKFIDSTGSQLPPEKRSFFQRKIANRRNIEWQYDNDFGVLKDD